MSENRYSLPPQIMDDIQGTLVMIILRPALVPSLNPCQALEFRYSWWGSDFVHKIKLTHDLDELRVVYDIRSDIKGFQRYLTDAEQLNVDIFVVSDQKTTASNHSPMKCQVRRGPKEWKLGDYIGKFTLNNLKLNARGEYISECNIINSYGNHLGSVIVFILFSSQLAGLYSKIGVQEEKLNELKELEVSDKTIQQCTVSSSADKDILVEETQSVTPTKYRKMPKENLSPRFVVFDNTTGVKKEKSPRKKCLKSPSKLKPEVSKPSSSNLQYEALHNIWDSDVKNFNSQICGNENSILTKLFSFVDTGVIHPSDLPTLIQICQGRTPSIDFDLSDLQDRTLSSWNNSSILSNDKGYESEMKTTLNETSKYFNRVTFCGSSYCSNSHSKQMESAHTLDREFSGSLSQGIQDKSNKIKSSTTLPGVKDNRISNKSPPRFKDRIRLTNSAPPRLKDKRLTSTTPPRQNIKDRDTMLDQTTPSIKCFPEIKHIDHEEKFETSNKKPIVTQADASLLVLRFHAVQFNYINLQNKDDNQVINHKKILVRQRSNLCYFAEVYLEFEEKRCNQSALYISRQITENQEIIFNTTRIFRLPTLKNMNNEGFIKFKVSRRRLGNRLRESVGVGIISINKLRFEDVGKRNVILPVWASSDSSEKINFSKNGKTEVPIGSFHFSVFFALSDATSCIDNQLPALPEYGIGNSNRLNLGQDDNYCDDNLPSTNKNNDNYCDDNLPSTNKNKDKDVLNETFTTESRLHFDNNYANNQESVIIENGSNVKYIPLRDNENVSIKQEFHLEIIEGNGFPLLRSKSLGQTFPPSAYVLASIPSNVHKTSIVKCCTTPVWNYRTNFALHKEDLETTNFNIVLKVFHSLNGITAQPKDPLLGVAQIETRFLWTSFLSLCGWIPVMTWNGELCGELKISLTPKKSRSMLRMNDNQINENCRDNFRVSNIDSIQSQPDTTQKGISDKHFEEKFDVDDDEAEIIKDCRKQLFYEDLDEESYIGSISPVCRSFIDDQPLIVSAEKVEKDYAGEEPIGNSDSFKNDSLYKSTEGMNEETTTANVQCEIIPCTNSDHVLKRNKQISDPNSSRDVLFPEIPKISSPPSTLIPVDNISKTPLKTHLVVEAMSWMNKGMDSPCVSYLDLSSQEREGKVKKFIKRKCRIAANLNFVQE